MKVICIWFLLTLSGLAFFGEESFACNPWPYENTEQKGICEGYILKHAIKKKEVYVVELDSENQVKQVKHKGKNMPARMGLYFNRCDSKTKVLIDEKEVLTDKHKNFFAKTKGLGQKVKAKWQTCKEKQPDGSLRTRYALLEINVDTKNVRVIKKRK